MKKTILLLIVLFLLPIVSAIDPYDMCTDTREIRLNCTMITPNLNCVNYTYDIYNISGFPVVDDGNLSLLNSSIYYFNLTVSAGDYVIELCDGSIREVRVVDEEDKLIGIVLMFIFVALLFIVLGIISPNMVVRFMCWMLGIVQILLLAGMVYTDYISGDLSTLLRVNFYNMWVVAFGLVVYGLYSFVIRLVSSDTSDVEGEDKKWGQRWK